MDTYERNKRYGKRLGNKLVNDNYLVKEKKILHTYYKR